MRNLRWLVLFAALVYAVLSTLTLARAHPQTHGGSDAFYGPTLARLA